MMLRLGDLGKRWQAITSAAATVVATATALFRPPPVGDTTALVALGGFLAAVSSGLVYVAMVRGTSRKHLPWWVATAAVSAIGAIACVHLYEVHWDSYVGTYQGEKQIVGDTYTPEGAEWIKQRGYADPSRLLFDAGGNASIIWTTESIARIKRNMRLTYTAGFPLIALGILSTIQAVHCALLRTKKRRSKPAVRASARQG